MWLKKTLVISSTADSEPPGWPLPALAVIVMMSRRTCRQMGESSFVFMENLLEKYISSTVKYIG